MNSSSHHFIGPLKANLVTRKLYKPLKMVRNSRKKSNNKQMQLKFTFHHLTFYAVPSAPPDNVQAGMLNLTAGWVRWSPPPPQHHNGHLLGYKIQVFFDNII